MPSINEIAKEIFIEYPQFEGVATFDSQGEPIVLKRGATEFISETIAGVPRNKLFWVFGQKDTTGRDEKLDPQARAAVFINQHTTLTQFVQGVGRMRGICANQRATVIIDQESSSLIKQALGKTQTETLSLLDLFEYFCIQEGHIHGFANFRSLSLQLDALVENFF